MHSKAMQAWKGVTGIRQGNAGKVRRGWDGQRVAKQVRHGIAWRDETRSGKAGKEWVGAEWQCRAKQARQARNTGRYHLKRW